MKTTETLHALRPEAQSFDPAWSEAALARVRRSPRRRRRTAIAVGACTLVVATAGAAAASGLVPAFVSETLDWVSPSAVAPAQSLAEFSFVDGERTRHVEMWTSTNDAGEQCVVLDETTARFGGSSGVDGSCSPAAADGWFGWLSEGYRIGEPAPSPVLYVYGENPVADAVEVRVTGDGFDHTFPVDPSTRGFAGAVPEVRLFEHGEVAGRVIATLQYLDVGGEVVRTKQLRER